MWDWVQLNKGTRHLTFFRHYLANEHLTVTKRSHRSKRSSPVWPLPRGHPEPAFQIEPANYFSSVFDVFLLTLACYDWQACQSKRLSVGRAGASRTVTTDRKSART